MEDKIKQILSAYIVTRLITSGNLKDQTLALGTRFRIFRQQLGGLDGIGIARMLDVTSRPFQFMAVRARPLFANAALPLGT
jgi:hypothetical protein